MHPFHPRTEIGHDCFKRQGYLLHTWEKREDGESDKQTLVREIKEELSADIIPVSIKYYGTFMTQAHGKAEGMIVRMARLF